MPRRLLVLLASMGLVALPAEALADDGSFTIGPRPVWFLTAGAGAGAAFTEDDPSGFVGGEASVVRLNENRFLGLYGDAYYDFGIEGAYITAGPELGLIRRSRTFPIAVGVDAGAALRIADSEGVGGAGRLFVGFAGMVTVFGRYAYLVALDEAPGAGGDGAHVVQVGMTFKLPLGAPFGSGAQETVATTRRD